LGSESETCVGSRVHLVGVSISFEKNFYRLPFTPPLSGSPYQPFTRTCASPLPRPRRATRLGVRATPRAFPTQPAFPCPRACRGRLERRAAVRSPGLPYGPSAVAWPRVPEAPSARPPVTMGSARRLKREPLPLAATRTGPPRRDRAVRRRPAEQPRQAPNIGRPRAKADLPPPPLPLP
jgi:hypothetical protein